MAHEDMANISRLIDGAAALDQSARLPEDIGGLAKLTVSTSWWWNRRCKPPRYSRHLRYWPTALMPVSGRAASFRRVLRLHTTWRLAMNNIPAQMNGKPLKNYQYKHHGSLVSLSNFSTVGSPDQ
ncbi:hypothetical protein ACNKHL_06650 [Shigella flexneri]